ncbi:MAG TPA: CHASE domain-containing protein [Roseiflexaceae bacterium]|nr:CHASE domain-containing protein [Roseiflexaceae bacterium]
MAARSPTPEAPDAHSRHPRLVAIVLILGIGLALLGFVVTWSLESRTIAAEFAGDAQAAHGAIRGALALGQRDLEVTAGLFFASSEVRRDEFHTFLQPRWRGEITAPGLRALVWAPHVPAAQRAALESAARRDGLVGFQFTERDPAGGLKRAGPRAAYYPAYYVEPLAGNEAALGFDLGSRPNVVEALSHARDTGRPTATAPLTLAQEIGPHQLVLVSWPIYRAGAQPGGAPPGRAALLGFVIGVFQAEDLVEIALAPLAGGLDTYVFDDTDPARPQLIHASAPLPAPGIAEVTPARLRAGLHHAASVPFGQRTWLIISRPGAGYVAARRTWLPWGVLAVGAAFAALTAGYIAQRLRSEAALRHERASLARRVEERTADLSRANAELARTARAKDAFLATMSHELRTPLNTVLMLADILAEQTYGPITERQRDALDTIDASGRHLLALINDILDLSRIAAGKLAIQPEPVSVAEICHASLQLVRAAAGRKSLALSLALERPEAVVQADPRRLKQILVNLLGNAIKFTPEGGRVALRVTGDAAAQRICFAVEDSGIGIAPEDLGRLFQPFVQLDSGLARQHEGTGLGLALVSHLAELHGGSVAVESVSGQGSRFTVMLPWRSVPTGPPPLASGGPPPTDAPARRGATVLLAEDNEANIQAIGDYLEHRGYRVAAARNGQEALERARELRPDIILMDVQMPLLDGMEVMCRLRAEATFAHTPIVALTALAMPGDRERCLQAGASEYMSKPVSLAELARTIDRLLQR